MPFPYTPRTPRGLYGLGAQDVGAATPVQDATQNYLNQRQQLVQLLLQWGEPFWLQANLGLGTTPAAGLQFPSITSAVDFDLLIVGSHCDLALSKIEIRDTARNRLLTNGPILSSAISTFTKAFGGPPPTSIESMDRMPWINGYYLLPARAQLSIVTTADGTESNGQLVFLCKQPPITTP